MRACFLCWLCIGLAVVYSTSVFAVDDAQEKSAELKQLRKKIERLNDKLQSGQQKKSKAEKELRAVEKRIGKATSELRGIDAELKAVGKQVAQLQNERQQALKKVAVQSKRLGREARAAYVMGRQQQVKLLLNQEQPEAVGRMQVYFSYFSRERANQIQLMRQTLDSLDQVEKDIQHKTESLATLREEHQVQAKLLGDEKKARQRAIASLARQLRKQGGELQRLKNDEKQLEELIDSLQELLADIPADASERKPFRTLKGQLRWPASGRLAKRFGSRRGDSGLKWQGVVIEAPAGGRVRAVSQGRVAFADWLRGFGLLLIIDHGDGYMSLYGHNQALYKDVGEWVEGGEVVATLGSSGGQTQAGLYFELRHKGRPVNPVGWCAGNPAGASG